MKTILGAPYTPPTSDEFQGLLRQAHKERAEAIREMWSSLFWWQHKTKTEPPKTYASIRSAL
jgi:hypothetical protein